jgi:quercetin dioxygenase-like cupin family protein
MYFLHQLENVEPRELIPGFHGRFIHTDSMTLVYWEIEQGATLPLHSHHHEQVANLLSGEFELTLDGVDYHLKAGSVLVIPRDHEHSGRAITACRILDVFQPAREDYR